MKNVFRKIALGLAAVGFALGAGGVYRYESGADFNELVYDLRSIPIKTVAVVGDTGVDSAVRKRTEALLDAANPGLFFLDGDELYDMGVRNEQEFIDHIMTPFYRPGRIVVFVGGNHTQYAQGNRDFLLELAASKKYPWFVYPYYFAGYITPHGCFVTNDTAAYDVKLLSTSGSIFVRIWEKLRGHETILDRQEEFTRWFLKEEACQDTSRYFIGHHGIYASDDSHGDRADEFGVGQDRFWKFYHSDIKGKVHWYINGHSHVTSAEVCEGPLLASGPVTPGLSYYDQGMTIVNGITCHLTVGAGAKLSKCVRGHGVSCVEKPGIVRIEKNVVGLDIAN